MRIRAARPDDAAAIRELERVVVAASLPLVQELLAAEGVAEAAGAAVDDALRLVAVAEGAAQPDTSAQVDAGGHTRPGVRAHANAHAHAHARIVGMIAVTLRGDLCRPHIRALAVAAAYRRRGVGLRLLRSAEEWAQEHGFGELVTNVAEDNHAALAFFHRAGYHEERGVLVKQLEAGQARE